MTSDRGEAQAHINWRGERVIRGTEWLDDPERGPGLLALAQRHLPLALFEKADLIDPSQQTREWANVVEHSLVVTGTALTIALELVQRGVRVDVGAVVDGAMTHELLKRRGIEDGLTRLQEDLGGGLQALLRTERYPELVVRAATNTGRLPDRYITDPRERQAAIAAKGIEAGIVALADAKVRGARVLPLNEALASNLEAKPADAEFFGHWHAYHTDVARYLGMQAYGFDAAALDEETVHQTLKVYADFINGRDGAPQAEKPAYNYSLQPAPEAPWHTTIEPTKISVAKDRHHPEANEDRIGMRGGNIVVADGSSPKADNRYEMEGRTAGQIAADIVTEVALKTDLVGRDLVNAMTDALADFYAQYHPEALENDAATFAASFVAARIVEGDNGPELVVTWVGDASFRINGGEPVTEPRAIDALDAAARSTAIRTMIAEGVPEEQAAQWGREAIASSLNHQYRLWNNANHPLGFGYINGRHVPDAFVHVDRYRLSDVRLIEFFTDGYGVAPTGVDVEDWEEAHIRVRAADPHRYLQYPATKPDDDRSYARWRLRLAV